MIIILRYTILLILPFFVFPLSFFMHVLAWQRSFSYAAPSVWSSLLCKVRPSKTNPHLTNHLWNLTSSSYSVVEAHQCMHACELPFGEIVHKRVHYYPHLYSIGTAATIKGSHCYYHHHYPYAHHHDNDNNTDEWPAGVSTCCSHS